MAEQPQSPPKGKVVSVFDVLHDIAQDNQVIDPAPAMRTIDRLARSGQVEPELNQQQLQEKYGNSPEYQGEEGRAKFLTDYKAAEALYGELKAGKFTPQLRTLPKGKINVGQDFDPGFQLNKYTYDLGQGLEQPFAPAEQLAQSRAKFIDASGQSLPLTDVARRGRNLVLDYELETDEYGKVMAPVFKELAYGANPYDKSIIGSGGNQAKEKTWLGAGWGEFYNSLMQIPSYVGGAYNAEWGNQSTNRLRAMEYMKSQYDSPTFADKWDQVYAMGGISPGSDWGSSFADAAKIGDEQMYDTYRDLKADEERIRALAKEGDIKSKLDANIIDLGDGLYGKGALQRIFEASHLMQKTNGIRASERAEKGGAFGSMEGFVGALGSTTAFMLPQMGAARGLAAFTMMLGERGIAKGLITQGLERGAQATLSKAGQKLVEFGSAAVPSLQMSGMQYDAAREAGYGHEDAVTLAAMAAPAIMLTEGLISTPWMMKSYLNAGGSGAYQKMLLKELGKDGASVGAKGFDVLRQKSVDLWAATTKFLKEGSDIAWKNRGKNMLEAGLRETASEGIEEGIYAKQEDILDWWTNKNLFEQQRGPQYSFWDRVKENGIMGFAAGGILGSFGNARRQPQPNDPSVFEAVADGKSKELMDMAQAMHDKGQISADDLQVVQQDVQRATEAIRGLDVIPPQYRSMIAQDQGIMRAYAGAVAQRNGLDTRIAELEARKTNEPASDDLDNQLTALKSERAQVDAQVKSVLDGTVLAQKLKSDAVQKHLAGQHLQAGINPNSALDAFTKEALAFTQSQEQSVIDLGAKRDQFKQALSTQIDALLGAKGDKTSEALAGIEEVRQKMSAEKVLTKEDASQIRNALHAARVKLMTELSELPMEKPPDDVPNMKLGARAQAFLLSMGMEDGAFQDWLDDEGEAGKLLTGDYGEDAKALFEAHHATVNALGAVDESADHALPSESAFKQRERSEVMGQFMNSVPMADGSSMDAESALRHYEQRTSSTPEELDQLDAIIQHLENRDLVGQWAAGPAHQVAVESGSANSALPGMKALAKENEMVYAPMAAIGKAQRSKAFNTLSDLKQERARLGKLLDLRARSIDRFDKADRGIRQRLIQFFLGFDSGFMGDKHVAELMAGMEKAIVTKNAEQEFGFMVQLEQAVHERLMANKELARKFIKHVYDSYGAGDPKNNPFSKYLNSRFTEDMPFDGYHNPAVFDLNWNTTTDKTMMGAIITHATNWVSRLSRLSPIDGYGAYNEVLSALKDTDKMPSIEQRERILDAVAMLKDSDQGITNELINALAPSAVEQSHFGVDRSLLLLGHPGTGKTTMAPFAINVLSKLLGRTVNVVVLAPGKTNTAELSQAITKSGAASVRSAPISELEQVYQGGQPDVIIVDEAHVVGKADIARFKSVAGIMPKTSFFFLGDENQSSALSGSINEVMPLKGGNMRTMPLSTSFRHGNVQLLAFFDDLRSQVFSNMASGIVRPRVPTTKYIDGHSRGVRLVDTNSPLDVEKMFIDDLKALPTMNGFLIVLDAAQRTATLQRIRTALANERNSKLDERLDHMVRHMDSGEGSVLGLEASRAYIAFGPEKLQQAYTRYLYTAVSRAKDSVVAMLSGGQSQVVKDIASTGGADMNAVRAIADTERSLIKSAVSVLGARTKNQQTSDGSIATPAPASSTEEPVKESKPKEPPSPSTILEQAEQARLAEEQRKEQERKEQERKTFPVNPPVTDSRPAISGGGVFMSKLIADAFNASGKTVEGVYTGGMDYIEGKDAESVENPKWAFRMALLKHVAITPGFRVDLTPVKDWKVQRAGSPAGFAVLPNSVQVHVSESEENLELLQAVGRDVQLPVSSFPEARALGLTMLGSLPEPGQADFKELEYRAFNTAVRTAIDANPDSFKGIALHSTPSIPGVLEIVKKDAPDSPTYLDFKHAAERRGMTVGNGVNGPYLKKTAKHGFAITVDLGPFGTVSPIMLTTRLVVQSDWDRISAEMSSLRGRTDLKYLDIEKSLAYQTVVGNSRMLVTGDLPLAALRGTWTTHEGVITIAPEARAIKDRLDGIDDALKILSRNQAGGQQVHIGVRTLFREGVRYVDPQDFDHLTSGRVRNVSPPALLINLAGRLPASQVPAAAGPRSFTAPGDSRYNKLAPEDGSAPLEMRTRSVHKVRDYYRRILGNRFVDGQLEFRSSLGQVGNRELYGVMENVGIKLKLIDGSSVIEGTDKHEAAHYIIEHVLDDRSRRNVLDDAARRIAERDGIEYWRVSDKDAHEFIAEQAEKQEYDPSTLVGRFLRWLRGVMRRWGIYRLTVNDLLHNIERGEYADAPVVPRDSIPYHSTAVDVTPIDGVEKTKDDNSPRDPYFLEKLFGGSSPVEALRRGLSSRVIQFGPYQAPISGDLTHPLPSLESAIENIRNGYVRDAEELSGTVFDVDGDRYPIEDVPFDVVLDELTHEQFTQYQLFHMARPSVFDGLIQTLFPGIDLEKLKEGKGTPDGEVPDTDTDAPAKNVGQAHNMNDRISVFDKQSALTTLLTTHMPLLKYDPKANHNGRLGWLVETDQVVDHIALRELMSTLSQGVLLEAGDKFDVLERRLKELIDKDPQSRQAAIARTFHARFVSRLSTEFIDANGFAVRSYRSVVENADNLLAKVTNEAERKAMIGRIDMAQRIVNGVLGTFINAVQVNKSKGRYRSADAKENDGELEFPVGRLTIENFDNGSTQDVLQDIKERTNAMFVGSLSSGIKMNPVMRQRFTATGEDAHVSITQDAVKFGTDTLVKITSDGSQDIYQLVNKSPELIQRFFDAAGYPLVAGSAQFFTSDHSNAKAREQAAMLPSIIGLWAAAIHSGMNTADTGKHDPNLWSAKRLARHKRGSGGIGKSNIAELHGERNAPAMDFDRISNLFTVNEVLAEVESRHRSSGGRKYRSVNGDTEETNVKGSLLTRSLPNGFEYASKGFEMDAPNLVKKDAGLKRGATHLNALLDPADPFHIRTMRQSSGVQRDDTGFGVEYSSTTTADAEQLNLTTFMKSILDSDGTKAATPLHVHGDRIPVRVETALRGKKFIDITWNEKGGVDGMTVNYGELDRLFLMAQDYYSRQKEVSLLKWSKVLGHENIGMEELAGLMQKISASSALASDVLVNTQDYIVEGDGIRPGNALVFGSTLFGDSARMAVNTDAPRGSISSLMSGHLQAYREALKENGVTSFDPSIEGSTNEQQRDTLIEAYHYITTLADHFTSTALQGPATHFKHGPDFTKRSVLAQSPSDVPMDRDMMAKLAVMMEPEVEPYASVTDGQGAAQWDGQAFYTPWGFARLQIAYGGPEGAFHETVNKPVFANNSFSDKNSAAYISPSMFRMNERLRNEVERSLLFKDEAGQPVDALRKVWHQAIDGWPTMPYDQFEQAFRNGVNAVTEAAKQLKIELPMALTSTSNVKYGLRGVNQLGQDVPLTTLDVDLRHYGLQTDLSRSLYDLRAPYNTQWSALMGVSEHNAALAARMRKLEADNVRRWLGRFQADLDKSTQGTAVQKAQEYLKQVGLEYAVKQGEIGQLPDTLADPNASVNDPIVKSKLMQYMATRLRSEGINPKMHGQQFTEVSAYGFTILEASTPAADVEQQVQSTQDPGAQGDAQGTGTPAESGQEQEAAPTTQDVEAIEKGKSQSSPPAVDAGEQGDQHSARQSGIGRPLRAPSREGKYQPGECFLPAQPWQVAFGLSDDMLHAGMEQIKSDILARLGSKALQLFEDSLNVYVSRTPMSSVSGGHMFKVVGFISDAGNSIFVPPNFHRLTDGDYDGDQLTVIMRNVAVDKDGMPYLADDPMGAMQNQMLEVINEFYHNPKNSDAIFTPTSVAMIRAAMKELMAENPEAYKLTPEANEFNTPYAALVARRRVFDGERLIGILASSLKGYSFLRQAYLSLNEDKKRQAETFMAWDAPEKGQSGPISTVLSGFMQSSLDNVKDPILGSAGINQDNINVVVGAILSGLPLKECLRIAKHPLVVDATLRQQKQRTAIREGAPMERKDLFQAIRDSQVPDVAILDENGNKVVSGPPTAKRADLVRYAQLGEAVRRMTEVFNLKVNGLPVDREGLIKYRHDTESWLGSSWETLAEGGPADPDYFMKMNPMQKDRVQYREDELALRQFFNPRAVVDALEHFKMYIDAADQVGTQLYGDAFADHTPMMEQRHRLIAQQLGRNGYFGGDGERVYGDAWRAMTMGVHINIEHGGRPVTLDPKFGPLDLSTPGGQWRFMAEFPNHWKQMIDKAMLNEQVREKLQTNMFISESRIVDREVPTLEMIDNRRLQDPVLRARVRRSIVALDRLIGDTGTLDMVPSRQIELYSKIKDKGSFRKGSMTAFLPTGAFNSYSDFLDTLMDVSPEQYNTAKLPVNGMGAEKTLRDVLNVFMEAVPVKYTELVPRGNMPKKPSAEEQAALDNERGILDKWSAQPAEVKANQLRPATPLMDKREQMTLKKPPHWGSIYFQTIKKVGYQRIPEIRLTSDPDVVLDSPWSRSAVPFAIAGNSLYRDAQVLNRLDMDTHTRVRAGEKEIKLDLQRASGLSVGPLYLPSGDIVQVTQVSEDGTSVVLDASSNSKGFTALEVEPLEVLHEVAYQDKSTYPSQFRTMDFGKALGMVADNSPTLGSLGDFLYKQHKLNPRNSMVTFGTPEEMTGETWSHYGHIDHATGDIYINTDKAVTPYLVEYVVMHEAVHRFTLHALKLGDSLLQSHDITFRNNAEALYKEAKDAFAAAVAGKKMRKGEWYGFKNVEEFIAEGMSNPGFQALLKELDSHQQAVNTPAPTTLWQKFINLIRSLFNSKMGNASVRNGYLSRLIDLTTGYIRVSTKYGHGFNEAKYDIDGASRLEHSIGVMPKFQPIKDIIDIADRLQSDPKIGRSLSQMNKEQQTIYHLNRMDPSVGYYMVGDRTFIIDGMNEADMRKLVAEQIIPFTQSYDHRSQSKMVDLLNGDLDDFVSGWQREFTVPGGRPADKAENIQKLLDQVDDDHGKERLYLRYSDLSNPEKLVNLGEYPVYGNKDTRIKDLGIKYVDGFVGHDPIIRLSEGKYGKAATIFSFTHTPMRTDHTDGPTWLSNFVRGNAGALAKKLRTPNDAAGIRKVMLALQVMALKQANPELKFRRIKVISLGTAGFGHESVWMHDMLQEIKVLRSVPALYNELPPSIKNIIDDEKLYDGDQYGQSELHQYADWLSGNNPNPDVTNDAERQTFTQRAGLTTELMRYERGEEGSRAHLYEMLKWRQRTMWKMYSEQSLLSNTEWLHIARTLLELENEGRKGNNTMVDMGKFSKFLKPASTVANDVFQHLYRVTMNTRSLVAKEVLALTSKDQERIGDMQSVTWNRFGARWAESGFVDSGWKRFSNLYRWSTEEQGGRRVVDAEGKRVRVRLNEIHWDKNDAETARLLASGQLSHKELEFANYVCDRIHDLQVESVMHEFKQEGRYINDDGVFNEAGARKDALEKVAKNWKRGWLPVMQRPASEGAYATKFKDTFSAMMREGGNVDEIFALDPVKDVPAEDGRIANHYMSEFWDAGSMTEHGSARRLKRLGLYNDGQGNTILERPEMNESVTENIELVLAYFTMAVKRQKLHEERTMPVYHAAKGVLATMKELHGKGHENDLAYLEDFARRMVAGEGALKEESKYMGRYNVAPLINIPVAITTYSGMALNPYVGLASGVMNILATVGTGLTNYTAKNGMFGIDDWMAAVGKFINPADRSERRKAMALMQHHFVFEMGEQDAINTQINSRTRKQLSSGHAVNFLNRLTDKETRALIMTAQMIKDGSWKAYSLDEKGNVHYDVKKDARFYDSKGALLPDGRMMMDFIKKRVINDGIVPQREDQPLQVGYDVEMGRVFKTLSDKYVIGGMDADQRTMADSFLIGRVLMQFRRYMPDKINNWFGSRKSIDGLGQVKVIEKDGKRMAVWEKREIESTVGAVMNLIALIRESKGLSFAELKNMSEADRTALVRGAYDLTMWLFLLALYGGLRTPDDDEAKKKEISFGRVAGHDTRLKRIIQNTAWDQVAGSPIGLLQMLGQDRSPAPSISTAWKMANLITDPSKVTKLLPGRQLVDMVDNLTEEDQPTSAGQ